MVGGFIIGHYLCWKSLFNLYLAGEHYKRKKRVGTEKGWGEFKSLMISLSCVFVWNAAGSSFSYFISSRAPLHPFRRFIAHVIIFLRK